MAKFVFKLQSYLGVKEKLEELKKLEYGRAVTRLENEKQIKIKLQEEQTTNIETFKQKMKIKIDPREFISYNRYIDKLKVTIIKQDKEIEYAKNFVEAKRLELIDAVNARKMLENIKEKHFAEYVESEKIAEQKMADEIVSYRGNSLKA